MYEIGYGQTRQQVTEMVKKILDKDGRPNPFKDNRPGRRHIELQHVLRRSLMNGTQNLSSFSFAMGCKINPTVFGTAMKVGFLCVPNRGKVWHQLGLEQFILFVLHKNPR